MRRILPRKEGRRLRRVQIPGTSLTVSRFVFGTGSLHHLGHVATQASHLEAAAKAGFSHFDTAPLYGFGGAERVFGEVFGADAEITVATKVGLYPPGGCDQGRAETVLRKIGGRVWPPLSRAIADFAVAQARVSLEGSLKRLGRQHVELLLLHEPDPTILSTDEWLRWLESERDRVGHVGIAGPLSNARQLLNADSPLASVVQMRDTLDGREADLLANVGRPMQFTYGYLSSLPRSFSSRDALAGALSRNTTGAIVVSTRSQERLREFAIAAAA
jgi:D-threo-aldose 1-dehydrogenase